MNRPLVSICIPNFNNARYLEACLESALNQDSPVAEVILADDASQDESLAIARRYRDRLVLLENPANLGQPQNTTRCIARAQGKYVLILHSDDLLLPECLNRLVPLLEKHPHVGLAAGERLETDETGVPRPVVPFYNCDCIIPGEKQAKVFMMAAMVPCQVLVRKSVLLAAGGIDPRHIVNLDGLLWFRCALHADVAYVQAPVCVYRRHAESTTARYNRSIRHMLEYHATLTEMFRLAADRPYLREYFDEAERRVGRLTVRYCHGVIQERHFDLARRYLALATVFDPEIARTDEYRMLKFCVESQGADPLELYRCLAPAVCTRRQHSYSPPEGFQHLAADAPGAASGGGARPAATVAAA